MNIPEARQPERFVPGNVYFIVLYMDEALSVPVIQTLIFMEQHKRHDGRAEYRFEEIKPHDESTHFAVQEEDVDQLVVDRFGLMKRLQALDDC